MHNSAAKRLLGALACVALVAGLASAAPAEQTEGCSRSSKSISEQLLTLSSLVDPSGKLSEYIKNSLPASPAPAASPAEPAKETTLDLSAAPSSQVSTVVVASTEATQAPSTTAAPSTTSGEPSTTSAPSSTQAPTTEPSSSAAPSITAAPAVGDTQSTGTNATTNSKTADASNVTVNVILQLGSDPTTDQLINNPNGLLPSLAANSAAPTAVESTPATGTPVASSTAAPEVSSTTAAPVPSTTQAPAKAANETTSTASPTVATLIRRRRDVDSSAAAANVTQAASTTAAVPSTSVATEAVVSSTPVPSTAASSETPATSTNTTTTTTTTTTTAAPTAASTAAPTTASTSAASTTPEVTSTTSTTTTTTTAAPQVVSSTSAAPSSELPLAAASEPAPTVANATQAAPANSTSASPPANTDTSSASVVEISAKDLPLATSEQSTTVATVEIVVSPVTNSSVNNETRALPPSPTQNLEAVLVKPLEVAAGVVEPVPVLLPLLTAPAVVVPVAAQQPANQSGLAGMQPTGEDMQEIASKQQSEACLGHGQPPVNVAPLLKKNKRLQLGYASLDSMEPHSMVTHPAAVVDNLNVIYDNETHLQVANSIDSKLAEPGTRLSSAKLRPTQVTKFVINEPTEESERENFATCALEPSQLLPAGAQLNQTGRLNFWQPIHRRGALHMLARFRYSKRPASEGARLKRESYRVPVEQVPGDGSQPIGRLVKHPIWLSSEPCSAQLAATNTQQNRSLLAEVSPTTTTDQLVDADAEMLLARFNLDEELNGIVNKYLTLELPSGEPLACCQVVSVPTMVATELESLPSIGVVQATGLH